MTTRTESAWSDHIASKLLNSCPEKIAKLRPSHTFTFEFDVEDFGAFCEHPKKIEEIINNAVVQACQTYWANYKAVREEKENGLPATQNVSKDNSSGRNRGLRAFKKLKVKLQFFQTVNMRDIGPKIEKEPIVVDGRILAVSTRNGYVVEADVYCPNGCDEAAHIAAGPTLRSFIPKCPRCKVKMHLVTSSAITDYVQTIKLQELDVKDSEHQAITFDVKVTGDDVFNTWIGKKVRIAGHFITDIDSSKNEHKQFIFSKYMHEIQEVEKACMSKVRADEIKEMLKQPENEAALIKSFAPDIEGEMDIKESMMYSFVGGSKEETRRTDISVLDIGNAGQGKSELLKAVTKIISKSMYFLGNSATSAGLGIGMLKLDNQTSVPQGGPLVFCSPHGTVCIDELDKMQPEDRNALLSAMEQQLVTKIVAGHKLSLPALVSVIAAANPKYGNWDESSGVVENINFEPYLLTRFDVVHCSVKTNSIKKQAIAAKILGLEPVTKEQSIKPLLSEDELAQYINYCKKLNPKLTDEAKKMVNDFYQTMSEAVEGEDKVVPMTPRELEGMIRLATARAKLLQKTEAGREEVNAVIRLKKAALESFPGIKVEGAGQQLNLLSTMEQKEKDMYDIIRECCDEAGTVNNIEVIDKWVEHGIFKNRSRAEREFDQLKGSRFFLRGGRYAFK